VSEKPGIRRAMYLVTSGNMLVPLMGVITAPIVAHALGVAGRGAMSTALAPNSLVVSVATLGLPEAITFELARRPGLNRRVLMFSTAVGAAIGALCLGVAALSASVLTNGDPTLANFLLLATGLAVPVLVVDMLRGAATGLQMWGAIGAEKAVNAVLRLAVLGGLAFTGELTIFRAVVVSCLTPIVAGAVFWRVFQRRPDTGTSGLVEVLTDDTPLSSHVSRRLMSYGSRVWIGAVASMLYGRLSQLIIVPLSDVAQLGLFAVAITFSDVLLFFANGVRDVIFGMNAREADLEQLTATARLMIVVCAAGALVLGAVLPWCIVPLFGPGFEAAVVPTWLLLLAAVLGIPALITGAGLGAWGRPGVRSGIVVVTLAVNVAGLVVLVPMAGAVGAGWAGVFSALTSSTLSVLVMARVSGARPLAFVLPRSADFALLVREVGVAVRRLRPRARSST
jgi:O-antigen/teichoic acid export membrane protein